MITNLLKIFDLNEKERNVFMQVLQLGGQPASQIARLMEIPRNTARDILDKLAKKGLLSCSRQGNTHYYSVESVPNMLRFLEIQKKRTLSHMDQQIEFVTQYKDALQPNKYHRSRPKVTFYEGQDGLRRVYEDTLTSSETIRAYASLQDMYEGLPNYFPEYFKRRAKRKIHIRAIFPDCKEAYERQLADEKEYRTSLIVPKDFHFTPEMNIYDNKFIIVSWKEKLAIMIESQEIADAMKAVFELAWLQAQAFNLRSASKRPQPRKAHS